MEKDIQPVFLCVFFKKDIQNSVEDEEDSSEDEEFYTSKCRTRSWSMVRHPSTGQNLLMTGADLLESPTGTVVAQRSEAGQGILGAKEGKGMWV